MLPLLFFCPCERLPLSVWRRPCSLSPFFLEWPFVCVCFACTALFPLNKKRQGGKRQRDWGKKKDVKKDVKTAGAHDMVAATIEAGEGMGASLASMPTMRDASVSTGAPVAATTP